MTALFECFSPTLFLVLTLFLMAVAIMWLVEIVRELPKDRRGMKGDRGDGTTGEKKEPMAFVARLSAGEAEAISQPEILTTDRVSTHVVFVLDSILASSLFRYCTSQGMNEVFTYISGLKLAPDRIVLQHIVPVAHAFQSATGAQTEASSTIAVHEMMDEIGLSIVAHCHSHPGTGPGGTCPSGTDRRYVAALAAGSSRLLGLIVSRDGFFRAYGPDGFSFALESHGKGIHEVSEHEHIFRIDERLGHGDLPLAVFGAAGGAACASSPREARRF
jgi:hypothetical protein